jgi:hypothetical protein
MNKLGSLCLTLAISSMASFATPCYAGSDRWIMVMTPERMLREKLIHVQLFSPKGIRLESDALKQMLLREQDCDAGHTFAIALDYKMGYEPADKLIGIYLLAPSWENKTLCFNLPGIGKVVRSFSQADNNGRSIRLNVAP